MHAYPVTKIVGLAKLSEVSRINGPPEPTGAHVECYQVRLKKKKKKKTCYSSIEVKMMSSP